ncbi:hypothetical protein C8R45DRAFT_825665, partial [Mycena sanguinolenta]
RSSDDVLFKLHRMNLKLHSEIFANADNATKRESDDDIVHLDVVGCARSPIPVYVPPATAQSPDCGSLSFLRASEKYMVYSTMPVVMMQAKEHIAQHPLQVLNYAALHGYVEVANKAARASVGRPMTDAVKFLAPDPLMKWV